MCSVLTSRQKVPWKKMCSPNMKEMAMSVKMLVTCRLKFDNTVSPERKKTAETRQRPAPQSPGTRNSPSAQPTDETGNLNWGRRQQNSREVISPTTGRGIVRSPGEFEEPLPGTFGVWNSIPITASAAETTPTQDAVSDITKRVVKRLQRCQVEQKEAHLKPTVV